jgi:hypothetical protein
MKRNMSLIMVFLFGCATAKMVEYVSFQDAVAKTGSKCHYATTSNFNLGTLTTSDDGKVVTKNKRRMEAEFKDGLKFIKNGWKPISVGGGGGFSPLILWEKCSK